MKQAKRAIEHKSGDTLRLAPSDALLAKAWLDHLDVPVAQLAPDKSYTNRPISAN